MAFNLPNIKGSCLSIFDQRYLLITGLGGFL